MCVEEMLDGVSKKIDPPEKLIFFDVIFDDGVEASFGEDFLKSCEVVT